MILAALLLPTLARAKESARRIACLNNLRQIGLALRMYIDDYNDTFPCASFLNSIVPEDWIYWDPNNGGIDVGRPRDIFKSNIAPYIGKFDTNLFRCPSDRILAELDRNSRRIDYSIRENQSFRFSYTLNSSWPVLRRLYSGNPFPQLEDLTQRGMASVFRWSPYPIPFHSVEIRDPAGKIMVAEEKMLYEMGSTFHGSVDIASSSGWEWPRDKLTERHNGRGNVTFADGHVQTVRPEFGQMQEHYDPLY